MQTTEARADELIKDYVAASAAAAAIPVPIVDLVAVTAVQLTMLHKLGRLYGARVGMDAPGVLAVGLLGAALPRIAASALKILPGIGWVGGTMAQAALSGAATWALGNTLRDRLGAPALERDFAPARGFALDDEPIAFADIARSLARAERLRRRGLLSEDEYERVRAELLNAV